MLELHLPWLELTIFTPLLGALLVCRLRDPDKVRWRSLVITGLTFFFAVGAWEDFSTLHTFEAHDHWDIVSPLLGEDAVVIDELSAPLLPLAALLFFLTCLATLRTKVRRFPFAWTLVSQTLVLAMLSCRSPWGVIGLLAAQTIPPFVELRARGRSTRVFLCHMLLFIGLLVGGWAMIDAEGHKSTHSIWAIGMLIAAVLVRSGCAPVHCWMTDLFENATLGTALLFVTPMAGAYAAVRLVLPIAPDWALQTIALLSLFTAVYAAGMALVQREARRFFVYLFLSHSSLVLIGLEIVNPIGLTGGLCVWISVGLSLGGFGLTLRAIEARTGRLSLADYHGLYEHMPSLATFFLLTGLASIGFPGTVGFIGAELLVEGAVEVYPFYVGMLVVLAAALNGIAVLHAFFRLFTGKEHTASISLNARLPEKLAVLALSVLIIGGGLFPQSGVASRYHAATEIMARREYHADQPGNQGHLDKPQKPKKKKLPAESVQLATQLRQLAASKIVIKPSVDLSYVDLSDSNAKDRSLRLLRNGNRISYLDLANTSITDDGVREISNLTEVEFLSLRQTRISNDALALLKNLTKLSSISFAQTDVDNAGLKHLTSLENLQTIDASGSKVTDGASVSFQTFSKLERLILNETKITDQGLVSIANISTLTWLELSGTSITDDGLARLKKLKGLLRLDLQNTRCTKRAIEEFKSALPDCDVITTPAPRAPPKVAVRESQSTNRII
jgi:NADH-quinone oxidoreductase subunit M